MLLASSPKQNIIDLIRKFHSICKLLDISFSTFSRCIRCNFLILEELYESINIFLFKLDFFLLTPQLQLLFRLCQDMVEFEEIKEIVQKEQEHSK